MAVCYSDPNPEQRHAVRRLHAMSSFRAAGKAFLQALYYGRIAAPPGRRASGPKEEPEPCTSLAS
jgi:hypothetical protein